MQELHGSSRFSGIAMAVVVVISATSGLSGVSEKVLQQGLKALRKGLAESDWPEVIIICDQLAIGSAVKLPGLRTIGIASQANDQPSVPLTTPCVAGIDKLLDLVASDQIVIVDGDQGVVLVEPDAQTIVGYQEHFEPAPGSRVFLESAHIPARTQDGRLVMVAAIASSIEEVEEALSQGADRLVVRFTPLVEGEIKKRQSLMSNPQIEVLEVLLTLVSGKHLTMVLSEQEDHLIEHAARFSTSGHVSFVSIDDTHECLSDDCVREAVSNGAEQVVVTADAVSRTKDIIRALPEVDADGIDTANG